MINQEMETLPEAIRRAIRSGAPAYNEGRKQECFDIYLSTATNALLQEDIRDSGVGELLAQAVKESEELAEENKYGEAAWVLRHSFDEILDMEKSSRRAVRLASKTSSDGWQDEKTPYENDSERGQALSDVSYILSHSLRPAKKTYYTKAYQDCFRAAEAVTVLASLGLGANRKEATSKCSLLLRGGFIVPVSHPNEKKFSDGTHLYRFPERQELQASLDKLLLHELTSVEGTEEHVCMVALQITLELPDPATADENGNTFAGISTRHLAVRRPSQLSPEHVEGQELAEFAANSEGLLDIADRKYLLKTYQDCFVGNDAVTTLVQKGLASDRDEATRRLNDLLTVGLIHHVTREHLFKDEKLFYVFTPVAEIRNSLDALSAVRVPSNGPELVRYVALVNRYKQFSSLDIKTILNDFYGCEDESGWDLVDLENWRLNMKRWGFGKPEDRDDAMIDRLAPVLLSVDPETWDVSGDESWESPFGILAQIAIFEAPLLR